MYQKITISGDTLEQWTYEKKPIKRRRLRIITALERKRKAESLRRFGTAGVFRRRADNLAKSRRVFAGIVRSHTCAVGNPALLTLSSWEVVDTDLFMCRFKEFIRFIRKRHKIEYVAVVEYQERGAPHIHALVWGFSEEQVGRERVDRLLQSVWIWGFLDIRKTDGSPKLANYLAKYLSKGLRDPRFSGKKAYFTSRNLVRPVHIKNTQSFSEEVFEELGFSTASVSYQKEYMSKWLGSAIYKLFKKDHEK